jgi:hypothetical protein
LPEQLPGDEEHVGGAFGEAAHEVGIPFAAKGDIDADVEALGDEFALQVAAYAEEHLELEMTATDVALGDEGFGGGDHVFVVGGEAVIDGALQEHVGELGVVGVDVGFFGEGDFGGFLVGAFAETDADAFGDELLDVGLGAVEIGLDDDADGAAQFGSGVDAAHDVERDLGDGRVFHVDAEEVAGGLGVLGEAGGDGFGEGGIEGETHLGKLDADVGVELARGDLIEKPVVDVGCFVSFFGGRNAFAEGIEGDVHALLVDLRADAEGVVNFEAGDEAGAELATDGGVLGKFADGTVVGKCDKGGTKNGHWLTLPGEGRGDKAFARDYLVSHTRLVRGVWRR